MSSRHNPPRHRLCTTKDKSPKTNRTNISMPQWHFSDKSTKSKHLRGRLRKQTPPSVCGVSSPFPHLIRCKARKQGLNCLQLQWCGICTCIAADLLLMTGKYSGNARPRPSIPSLDPCPQLNGRNRPNTCFQRRNLAHGSAGEGNSNLEIRSGQTQASTSSTWLMTAYFPPRNE